MTLTFPTPDDDSGVRADSLAFVSVAERQVDAELAQHHADVLAARLEARAARQAEAQARRERWLARRQAAALKRLERTRLKRNAAARKRRRLKRKETGQMKSAAAGTCLNRGRANPTSTSG